MAFFTLTSSTSLPEKWIIEILIIQIHSELLEGPAADHGWKLRCTTVLLALPVLGKCHGHREILGQLSKATKFGLFCFSIFSFQCVMRTFQIIRNDFLAGLCLPVSGNKRQVFQQRILTMDFYCVIRKQLCRFLGQKWFKYSCFLDGKGYGGSEEGHPGKCWICPCSLLVKLKIALK